MGRTGSSPPPGLQMTLPGKPLRLYDELLARGQYRAPGLEWGSFGMGCLSEDVCSVRWFSVGFFGGFWCLRRCWFWCLRRCCLVCRLPARFFSPAPLSSSPFLFLSFSSPLRVRQSFFSVLPPTRTIQDNLRCLAADAGRTGAQLLGDERSGSAEPPFMGRTKPERADLAGSGQVFCGRTAMFFLAETAVVLVVFER
jgi:hypothetical protein